MNNFNKENKAKGCIISRFVYMQKNVSKMKISASREKKTPVSELAFIHTIPNTHTNKKDTRATGNCCVYRFQQFSISENSSSEVACINSIRARNKTGEMHKGNDRKNNI